MKYIDYKSIGKIDFMLNGLAFVNSLEEGATKYGGATSYKGHIYSNYYISDIIKINPERNGVSLYIPSTNHIDFHIDNAEYVIKYLTVLASEFDKIDFSVTYAVGAFNSDKLNKIIYENVTIITFYFNRSISIEEIKKIRDIALVVKEEMTQESVSFSINNALCFV